MRGGRKSKKREMGVLNKWLMDRMYFTSMRERESIPVHSGPAPISQLRERTHAWRTVAKS